MAQMENILPPYTTMEAVHSIVVYDTDAHVNKKIVDLPEQAEAEICELRRKTAASLKNAQISQGIVLAFFILALAVATILCLQIIVLRPLRKCLHGNIRLAVGDLSERVELKRNDELGSMARSIEQTRSNSSVSDRTVMVEESNVHIHQVTQASNELSSLAGNLA